MKNWFRRDKPRHKRYPFEEEIQTNVEELKGMQSYSPEYERTVKVTIEMVKAQAQDQEPRIRPEVIITTIASVAVPVLIVLVELGGHTLVSKGWNHIPRLSLPRSTSNS